MSPSRSRFAVATLAIAVASVVAIAALSACAPSLPSGPPGTTGTVTSLQPGDERPAQILVEGPPQPAGAVSDKASVTIETSTQFFDATGKSTKPSGISVGSRVSVWFTGPVAESYPVQGSAKAVQILGQ